MELNNSPYASGELQKILRYFAIENDEFQFQALSAGYINDTFLVSNVDGPLYILQRINHLVFENIDVLMANMSKALIALTSKDYMAIQLIPTREGGNYTKELEGHWRLMSYIPNSTTFNNSSQNEVAFEAGRVIGKFHLLLQHQDLADYKDSISNFHDLAYREKEFKEALGTAKQSKLESAEKAIDFAKRTLTKLKEIDIDQLPFRVCHNDTKLNNILFSTSTGKALCLIDLDTIMKGYFFNDFGDAVRTIANTAPEDEQNHNKILFDKELFRAFIDGLASNGTFLSQKELRSLPMGAVFMPFIHGLRALTDYLNDNRYYKVTYDNQNLDRCLSLFDFAQKAQNNMPFMERVIQDSFSN
jgi:Ser/Thr protein kinase RdoA (MazF antagonist)